MQMMMKGKSWTNGTLKKIINSNPGCWT